MMFPALTKKTTGDIILKDINTRKMKVKEIISLLESMPQEMQVYASKGSEMPSSIQYVEKESDLGVVVIHIEK